MVVVLTENNRTVVTRKGVTVEVTIENKKNYEVIVVETQEQLDKLNDRHGKDLENFLDNNKISDTPILAIIYYDKLYNEENETDLMAMVSCACVSDLYVHLVVEEPSNRNPLITQCIGDNI